MLFPSAKNNYQTKTPRPGILVVLFDFMRRQPTFTTAYEVLEAYSVGAECGMYPSDGVVGFSKTQVAFDGVVSAPAWETHSCPSGPGCAGRAECGERTTVDNGVVNIHFQSTSHDVAFVYA